MANVRFSDLPTVTGLSGNEIFPLDQAGTTKTATVSQLVQSSSGVLTSSNIWTQGNYFQSGRPWADVRAFGAVGTGAANDVTAFSCAINTINALGGGIVYVPPGSYFLSSGISLPTGVYLNGASEGFGGTGSVITSCNGDYTLVTINGVTAGMQHMHILGGGINSVNPVVVMSAGSEQVIEHNHVEGGAQPIKITNAVDWFLLDNNFTNSYGSANCLISNGGGGYAFRNKFNASWQTFAPAVGAGVTAWTSGTAYALGAVVTSTAGYYIQATSSGTSGGVSPTLQNYGINITDNTVTWRLRGANPNYGVLYDTGALITLEMNNDHSGAHTAGVAMLNTQSSNSPQNVIISDGDFGNNITNGILAQSGYVLNVKGCQFSSPLDPAGTGITISSSFLGETIITNSNFFSGANGVLLNAGRNTIISNNTVSGMTSAAISVAAGVSNFNISNNMLAGSSLFSPNVIGIQIAPGSSGDYYSIANNVTHGVSSTEISDGGFNQHKITMQNSFPGIGFGYTPVIDAVLKANLGNSSVAPPAPSSPGIHLIGSSGVAVGVTTDTFGGAGNMVFRRAEGTMSAPTALTSNVSMLAINGQGYTGSSYSGNRARILFNAAEAWSSAANGTYIAFYTTSTGTSGATEKIRVRSGVTIGSNITTIDPGDPGAGAMNVQASVTAQATLSIPAGGIAGAGYLLSATPNYGVFFGSGAPTITSAQGSLYLRSDGASSNTRMYVNSSGSSVWQPVITNA